MDNPAVIKWPGCIVSNTSRPVFGFGLTNKDDPRVTEMPNRSNRVSRRGHQYRAHFDNHLVFNN